MQCWLCERRPATLKILHCFLLISLNSKYQYLRQIIYVLMRLLFVWKLLSMRACVM